MFSKELGEKLDKFHLLKHPFTKFIGTREN